MSLTVSAASSAVRHPSHAHPYSHLPTRAVVNNIGVTFEPHLSINRMPPLNARSGKVAGTIDVNASGLADRLPNSMALTRIAIYEAGKNTPVAVATRMGPPETTRVWGQEQQTYRIDASKLDPSKRYVIVATVDVEGKKVQLRSPATRVTAVF